MRNEMQTPQESTSKFPEMLTIDQTAARSGLSAYTVRKLARSQQGAGFTIRVGQKYLLNWDKFTAFFNCEHQEPDKAETSAQPAKGIQPVPVKL